MAKSRKSYTVLEIAQGKMPISEKEVESVGDRFMATLGFTSIHFSQARATNQTPGIPDRKYYNPDRGVACWWEAKAKDGKQSEDQWKFQNLAEQCDEVYLLGDSHVLVEWLTDGCPKFSAQHAPGTMLDRFRPERYRWKPKR